MALVEFSENWEEHMRTVSDLKDGDDRVQLAIPNED